MATDLFATLLRDTRDIKGATTNSVQWLREQAMSIRSVNNPRSVISRNPERLVTNIMTGRMYLFMYDPATKDTLPYYDRFPLIFPFRKVTGGFYGINMHYLPHMLRARLMDSLYSLANNDKNDDTTRLIMSYRILNRAARFRFFKPCVKHYLNSQLQSRFLWIPADQWNTALFLPLERFVGATRQQVFNDSRRMVRR